MTRDIQKEIGRMLVLRFHSPVIENFTPYHKYEYDVFSVSKSNMVYEFEVKISRSDFKTPKEKSKMIKYGLDKVKGVSTMENDLFKYGSKTVCPNYFSYCCPDGLIKPNEIPSFAGLYYLINGGIIEIKKPKLMHKHILAIPTKKLLRYFTERHFLGSCRMTYENKIIVEQYNKLVK